MKNIFKILLILLFIVLISFPVFYIVTSNTLIYKKYFDVYLYYLLCISFTVTFVVVAYMAYKHCYLKKCVEFYAYIDRETTSIKKMNVLAKIFIVPIILIIFAFMAFTICFLLLFMFLETYLHIYTLFNSQRVYEYMYMQYDTSSYRSGAFAVATPDRKYKLHGYLNAIGFDSSDKKNTPYIVLKNEDGSAYIKKGYLYKIWTKKNKYGYFVSSTDDYVRIISVEYSEERLRKIGCIEKHGTFTCKGIKLERFKKLNLNKEQ